MQEEACGTVTAENPLCCVGRLGPCAPDWGCKSYILGMFFCTRYTLVHVFGLKPAHHRGIAELKPTIKQATSRLSQQSPVSERRGINSKICTVNFSLATASESFSDVGILILTL